MIKRKLKFAHNKINYQKWSLTVLFASFILLSCTNVVLCSTLSYKKGGKVVWGFSESESPVVVYTEGDDLQEVIDKVPNHSTVICNRNRQLIISVPISINKPLTLKGINARLPDGLGNTPLIKVTSEGVAITDFVLRGNAATVPRSERTSLIAIFFGNFRIERGLVENSSKDGIEVDQQDFPNPVNGGVIRDIVGKGCVRDVVSLGGPAGSEPHVQNILVENIRGYDSSMRGTVEVSDGAENITVRKIYAENCFYAIDIQDHNKREINRNILIVDVYALRCSHAIRTANHPNGHSTLTLKDVVAEQCERTLYVSNTDDVNIQNVKIIGYSGEGPAMSVTNCDVLTVRDITLVDCTSRGAGLLVENCNKVNIDGVMMKNTGSLSSAVTYRISEDRTFSNLSISNVYAKGIWDAGIILEKGSRNALLSDYIISGNIAKVSDRIEGANGLIINNIWIRPSNVEKEKKPNNQELPNIVLIMADDMGKECVGCYGNIEYKTPNIDRLASAGIRFDHCYSQPLCTPSRVKIMTGKYNFRNYEDFGYLNPNQKTFGNLLKEAGYETCIAGKWQLNGLNRNNPGNQDVTRPYHFGFDEYCLWQLNRPRSEGERYANPLLTQNGKDLPRNRDAFGPQVFADYLTDFIDRKAGKPFFIYYPMVLPHNPFVPTPDSPEWDDPSLRYDDDTVHFGGMVAYIDKIVGQIEAKLKEKEVWENTLFIFTADNGTKSSVVSQTSKGNIKGGKGKTINTGNHVPLIISWPQKIKEGRTFQGIVDFADILPTLADIVNINPTIYETDGKSFYGVLSENARDGGKDETFIHYTPRWGKLDHNRWVMNGEYKLYQDGRFFNTRKDPDENSTLSDLSGKEKAIKQKFDAILREKEEEFPFNRNNKKFQKK